MSVPLPATPSYSTECELIRSAVDLLSQQVWCWGCDITRPAGNWLLEVGFQRIEPPAGRDNCSSVYSLELPLGRCVVLRGFGAFYGDQQRGCVFLPRYRFRPQYTPEATLARPPWSEDDLPEMHVPSDPQRSHCASLTLDLIDWIRAYEVDIVKHLGLDYRRSTLVKWAEGKDSVVPAEEMASAWRQLGMTIAKDFQVWLS